MKKILVIEDEEFIRANILDLLAAEQFTGIGAENGVSGIELAQQHLPDLIICDIMMPGLDGYEVLQTLLQKPVTATIPFIFLTAKADSGEIRRGMGSGADDYLTKPCSSRELLQAITARLEKRSLLSQQVASEGNQAEELRQTVQEL